MQKQEIIKLFYKWPHDVLFSIQQTGNPISNIYNAASVYI